MGEPRGVDDVADGEDVRLVGLAVFVDLDGAAWVDDDLCVFEAEAFEIWHATDGDEQHFGFERDGRRLWRFCRKPLRRFVLFELVELYAGLDLRCLIF